MDGVQDLVKSPGKAVQGLGSSLGGDVGSKLGDKVSEKVDEAGGPGRNPGRHGEGRAALRRRRWRQTRAAASGSVRGAACRCSRASTSARRSRRSTTSGRSSRTGPSSCIAWSARARTRTTRCTSPSRSGPERVTSRRRSRLSDPTTGSSGRSPRASVHAGLVSFHELAPNLTRVLLSIDVQPGGMIEKMARGMRHVKRAARGDLHRFKAYIEMAGEESGAWRGVIEDGEVVEEHDPSYDEDREYSDPERRHGGA